MGEVTGLSGHLGNGPRTPEQSRAKADELMRKIEDDDLIPQWCWGPMTDTVSKLSALGDEFAWLVPAYLASVVVRGPAMFRRAHRQLGLEESGHAINEYGTLPCPCGRAVPSDRPVTRGNRQVRTARCGGCHVDLVEFDGVPFTQPTLIAPGFVYHQ